MKLYRVTNWDAQYETCETKKITYLKWVPVPNKHDGLGYKRVAMQKNACDLFTAWNLIIQVASKGKKDTERGMLIRDKVPLTPEDLALMTSYPAKIFITALEFFSSSQMGWLTIDNQQPPDFSGSNPVFSGASPAEGRKEGIEGKKEGALSLHLDSISIEPPKNPSGELKAAALLILLHLNEKAGRKFEPRDETLKPIMKRLGEGYAPEEIKKMIDREVKLQGPHSKWLQTSTLFCKNFPTAYDDRNLSIPNHNTTKPNARNFGIAQSASSQGAAIAAALKGKNQNGN